MKATIEGWPEHINTTVMTVYLVISLPKFPYINRTNMDLANPTTIAWDTPRRLKHGSGQPYYHSMGHTTQTQGVSPKTKAKHVGVSNIHLIIIRLKASVAMKSTLTKVPHDRVNDVHCFPCLRAYRGGAEVTQYTGSWPHTCIHICRVGQDHIYTVYKRHFCSGFFKHHKQRVLNGSGQPYMYANREMKLSCSTYRVG